MSNLIKLLVSIISHYSQRLSANFWNFYNKDDINEEFVEICEQIHEK